MPKAILMSIKPKYVAEILNHRKTVEIRKTMPKCDLPIEVYVYCTKDERHLLRRFPEFYLKQQGRRYQIRNRLCFSNPPILNGRVVAKFTLMEVERFSKIKMVDGTLAFEGPLTEIISIYENACLSLEQLLAYCKIGDNYAWHISNLVIFDKPKELRELYLASEVEKHRREMRECGINESRHSYLPYLADAQVSRAPESWCYVEAKE